MAFCRRCATFMMGIGLGAAAGVLLAPKSGKEIRKELFGGSQLDILAEPGAGPGPSMETEAAGDLKTRIEETRARLKSEIEAEQEGQQSSK
ncbi:MAG: YtxH domain-containing protein [Thermoleophilia bacterium]|nr:YtxH domain-containing protein [Thermoleophilia bacterium]